MKSVAFGPVSRVPSWQWVGAETAQELAKYYKISTFKDMESPPKSDVIVIIKKLPSSGFVKQAKNQGSKVIYCPVDYFEDKDWISGSAVTFRLMDMVLIHCERLAEYIKPYVSTHMVDHHGKYTLAEMAPYKENGYVLWVGGFQFVPYLVKWLKAHPIRKHPIKLLTDYKNQSAIAKAQTFAQSIGVTVDMNQLDLYDWSEDLQTQMMQEAKAAIDIKGSDFQQFHKPPTKAQKYISSGIPIAMNKDSSSSEHFGGRGFNIASPLQESLWFSKEYYDRTYEYGKKLRNSLSIDSVGKKYKQYIDMCLSRR